MPRTEVITGFEPLQMGGGGSVSGAGFGSGPVEPKIDRIIPDSEIGRFGRYRPWVKRETPPQIPEVRPDTDPTVRHVPDEPSHKITKG